MILQGCLEKMTSCPFCALIEKGSENIVYEDEKVIAMLDPNSAVLGQISIMPKEHYPILEQVPDKIIEHLFKIANLISVALFEQLNAQGTNIILKNGTAAGQEWAHFMATIIPRKKDDGLKFEWTPKHLSEEEMSTVELTLKDTISGIEKDVEAKKEATENKEEKETKKIKSKNNYMVKQLHRMP